MSERLEDIAIAMVAEGQGILAADESTGTIKKRFDSINVESTEDSRRDYREMLFRSDEAMNDYISGVILFEETLYQKAADGTPFVDLIRAAGAVPGIKVDKGAQDLTNTSIEKVTEGLDGLRGRLADYYEAVLAASNNKDPKLAANWVMGDLSAGLNKSSLDITDSPVPAKQLGLYLYTLGTF